MRIPLSRPDITDLERQAVQDVLLTPYLALGPTLKAFEKRLANYHGRAHAIAVNSGTSALHLAMLALGVVPGDEVITTPFSFVASANCILYVDGVPRFVDIDPGTWNLDVTALPGAVTPRTRGVLPVHVFGLPCDMATIGEFARTRSLWVVEDACEAIGAYDRHAVVGKSADISVLAFYPNKQITTGEGGIVLTDDAELAYLCRSLRNQGRSEDGAWLHHERLGYNYRMSDIAAALGLAQMNRLDEILHRRQAVAEMYQERLAGCDWLRFQITPPGAVKSWFVYVVALAEEYTREDRDAVLEQLTAQGIGCSDYFSPIHLQPFMRERFGFREGDFPVCESVASRTLALPFHGRLTESDIDAVCLALREAVARRAHPGMAVSVLRRKR